MIKESGIYYNNPLFYIFMVLVLASFTYETYYYNKLAAILIATSLFFLIAFNTERHLKVFLMIIFISSLIITYIKKILSFLELIFISKVETKFN